jgi:hypothetical protein
MGAALREILGFSSTILTSASWVGRPGVDLKDDKTFSFVWDLEGCLRDCCSILIFAKESLQNPVVQDRGMIKSRYETDYLC